MSRLLQLFNYLLNSHPFGRIAIAGGLFAFVLWWNFGKEFDAAISDAKPQTVVEEPMVPVEPVASSAPLSATKTKTESPKVQTHEEPAKEEPTTPSIDERMRAVECEALVAKMEKLVTDFSALQKSLTAWNQRVGDLAANDIGRRMANQPATLGMVETLIQSEPISANELLVLQKRMRIIEDETIQVRAQKISTGLEKMVSETKALLDQSADAVAQASISMNILEKQSLLEKPSSMTLAEAIVKQNEQLAISRANVAADEKKNADEKIAALDREAAEIENQQKMQAAGMRVDAAKQRLDEERQKLKLEAEKRQLEADFQRDLPEIKRYLGKLFMDGHTQPVNASMYVDVGTTGPVSLARLVAAGALNDKVEGDGAYSSILHLMVSKDNDRKGAGPYPQDYIGGSPYPAQAAAARPAYQFLKKYGQLLVEKGYLQK